MYQHIDIYILPQEFFVLHSEIKHSILILPVFYFYRIQYVKVIVPNKKLHCILFLLPVNIHVPSRYIYMYVPLEFKSFDTCC